MKRRKRRIRRKDFKNCMMLAAGLSVLIIPLFVLLIMEAVSADGYEEDNGMPTVAPLVIETEEQEHSVVDLISL